LVNRERMVDIGNKVHLDAAVTTDNKELAYDMLRYFGTYESSFARGCALWWGIVLTLVSGILYAVEVTHELPSIMIAVGIGLIAVWALCFWNAWRHAKALKERERKAIQAAQHAAIDPAAGQAS
jgi:protein-S-isoprenylcysteine O-methyltransferase Ste14